MSPLSLHRVLRPLVALGVGAFALTGCTGVADSSAAAEDQCADLDGQDISLVVPYEPGGGYDAYARILAPQLGQELNATVVVENKPGAGGLLALTDVLKARPDGTTMAIMNGIGSGGAALANASGANFELDDFTYLARVAANPQLVVTGASGPYGSIGAVRNASGFRWGSTGPGASDFVTPSILTEALGLNAEVLTGFSGSGENALAIGQGNVDGMTGDADSRRSAVQGGQQVAILSFGGAPEWAPQIPTVASLDLPAAQREILDAHVALVELGRPLVAPPDLDEGLASCMQEAVGRALQSPDLLAEAERQQRPIEYLSGQDVTKLVADLQNAPPSYIELLRSLY